MEQSTGDCSNSAVPEHFQIKLNKYSNRVVDVWNGLPVTVVTASSLNTFKSRLNKYWHGHNLTRLATSRANKPGGGSHIITKAYLYNFDPLKPHFN